VGIVFGAYFTDFSIEKSGLFCIIPYCNIRASNIMKKTWIDTVDIRHGLTRIYTVYNSFLCVLCVLCG
jgi:hypothetical protein